MKTLDIPGSYVNALATGEFCCETDAGMQTHLGLITYERGLKPLYATVSNIGGFRFAGQSHNSPETLVWSFGWSRLSIVACGISPCIYDLSGLLHIADCSEPPQSTNLSGVVLHRGMGSQGYRYVDPDTGALVTGDATYGSDFGLSEWTAIGGGMFIGQCNVLPGTALWDGTALRLITAGETRFVRAHRDGERVAVAQICVGGPSRIQWTTVAELRALPALSVPAPTPQPPPTPVPNPPPIVVTPPSPEPVPMPVSSLDLRSCQLVATKADLLDFAVTAQITRIDLTPSAEYPEEGLLLEFSKQDTWPPPLGVDGLQFTVGLCRNVGGQWFAAAGLPFWHGASSGHVGRQGGGMAGIGENWFGKAGFGPMQGWQPREGEQVGFFVVQGNWRLGAAESAVRERSDVVLLEWHLGQSYRFNVPTPQPQPVPVPVPEPPPVIVTPNPPPVVTPPVVAPGMTAEQVQAAINGAIAELKASNEDLRHALTAQIADLKAAIAAKTAPVYTGQARVFGQSVTFTLTPKT